MEDKDRIGDRFTEIEVSRIKPNPKQSRKSFEKGTLKSLAKSIRKRGLLQPINVRPDPENEGHYVLVHGERRWRACKLIGLERVPAIVRNGDYTEDDLAIDQLVENLCREDLKVIEKSEGIEALLSTIPGIKRLPKELRHKACLTMIGMIKAVENGRGLPKPSEKNFYLTGYDLEKCSAYMKMIDCSFNTVLCHLKVLELPSDLKKMVVFSRSTGRKGKTPGRTIPFRIAYELSRLENADLIRSLAKRILGGNWTSMRVRATVDTIIEENMQEYGDRYRSKKVKYKDLGMSRLADDCFDLASRITNWRRLCLKRLRYTPMETDFKVGLKLLREATKELGDAIDAQLEGTKTAEEKRNVVVRNEEFVVRFGGQDNRVAIPSKIIKAYEIPSFRSKAMRKKKIRQKWKLKVKVLEAWEVAE